MITDEHEIERHNVQTKNLPWNFSIKRSIKRSNRKRPPRLTVFVYVTYHICIYVYVRPRLCICEWRYLYRYRWNFRPVVMHRRYTGNEQIVKLYIYNQILQRYQSKTWSANKRYAMNDKRHGKFPVPWIGACTLLLRKGDRCNKVQF